jgi:hypothetical protein
MPKLTERIAKSGVNFLVVVIAIVVFVVAMVVMMQISSSSKPATIDVLAAARDLSFGEPITPADLVAITVYQDKLSELYISSDQADKVVGGYVAIPMAAGQPVMSNSVVATAGEASRLSAILAEYPGHSLFPLPLDLANVVSADANSYLPGDLVSVTIVLDTRPQVAVTPTPNYDGFGAVITPTPYPAAGATSENTLEDALNRGYPPMAKNLYPEGALVVAVQGLPVDYVPQDNATDINEQYDMAYAAANQPKRLILLVPSESVEPLAYGLLNGDMVVVSMVTAGQDDTTTGFSYWDLEELFRLEREQILKETP